MKGFSGKGRSFPRTCIDLSCPSMQILLPGSDNSELSLGPAPGMSSRREGETSVDKQYMLPALRRFHVVK